MTNLSVRPPSLLAGHAKSAAHLHWPSGKPALRCWSIIAAPRPRPTRWSIRSGATAAAHAIAADLATAEGPQKLAFDVR